MLYLMLVYQRLQEAAVVISITVAGILNPTFIANGTYITASMGTVPKEVPIP